MSDGRMFSDIGAEGRLLGEQGLAQRCGVAVVVTGRSCDGNRLFSGPGANPRTAAILAHTPASSIHSPRARAHTHTQPLDALSMGPMNRSKQPREVPCAVHLAGYTCIGELLGGGSRSLIFRSVADRHPVGTIPFSQSQSSHSPVRSFSLSRRSTQHIGDSSGST
jgi:hypothetical protein